MLSIKEQCYKLYMDAFKDDEQFTKFLFDNCFDDCCYYLTEGDIVVSMLFAFDVFLNGVKGKYIYGVATDEKYRGKGYMRKLFDKSAANLKNEYKFLCLRPMTESLFGFYDKLGFSKKFYKGKLQNNNENSASERVSVNNADDFMRVRKSLLKSNFVELGDKFSSLILNYCDVYTDSLDNPQYLVVRESQSGKIKEYLTKSDCSAKTDFCFAVFKSLGYDFEGKGYLGLAMD